LLARNTASCEAMFYAIGACVAAATCATAFEVKSEFVARFMLEVLDVPMEGESRSRRLQGIDWDDAMRDATPGQQISALFHAAVNGSLSSGRRLSYTPETLTGEAMAKFMDLTVHHNDHGCDGGVQGQRLAEEKAYDDATRKMKEAIGSVKDGKWNNQQAISLVRNHDNGHPVVQRMLHFLGGWVTNTLTGNIGLLGKGVSWIGKALSGVGHFAMNVVKGAVGGLKWIGSKVGHFFGFYDVRVLGAAISAPKAVALLPAPSSVTPNLKVFSVVKFPMVMVAGMVTMLALLVAGMRQWKKRKTSVDMMEEDNMLAVDVVE